MLDYYLTRQSSMRDLETVFGRSDAVCAAVIDAALLHTPMTRKGKWTRSRVIDAAAVAEVEQLKAEIIALRNKNKELWRLLDSVNARDDQRSA